MGGVPRNSNTSQSQVQERTSCYLSLSLIQAAAVHTFESSAAGCKLGYGELLQHSRVMPAPQSRRTQHKEHRAGRSAQATAQSSSQPSERPVRPRTFDWPLTVNLRACSLNISRGAQAAAPPSTFHAWREKQGCRHPGAASTPLDYSR